MLLITIVIEFITILLIAILVGFYGFYFFFTKMKIKEITYEPQSTIDFTPSVSIVMATYNEEAIIKDKIKNIEDVSYPRDKLEVVVVDSSNDGTRDIIKDWIKTASMRVLLIEEESRRGLATALNIGYAAASGTVVIKNDADIFIEKQSIKEIVKYFVNPHIGGATGALKISSGSSTEIGYKGLYQRMRLSESNIDSTYIFEPFSAYRKTAIVPISTSSVADDCELALEIRKNGYKTVFAPKADAYDNCPTEPKQRFNQKSRRAQGHILLIRQNLSVSFNSKYGKFGSIVFPANVFMILISPWLMLLLIPFGFLFLTSLFGLLAGLLLAFGLIFGALIVYIKSTPKAVAGFLESQIALIIASLRLATRGPDFMWEKQSRNV